MENETHKSSDPIEPGDFFDIIKEQKNQYDACFALKRWRPSPVLHPETTKSITDKIVETPRMKDTILQLVARGQGSREEIILQARKILQEMGHTYDFKTVRMIGYFLAKLLRQLYHGIDVLNSGMLKLSKAMSEAPVLLLPTHRSYADFLLISYVCYTFNVPLPVIAAGMDFKGMKFVNQILQNAGAFYIRRSFGSDLLYWAAVSEYMRHQILNFQAPIEFFLEGTRSRNGKSLPPKIGLLTIALEPYFKGDVPDIQICTMSITYERILEETLYAYEVLGIPKPRESTAGFLSAVEKIKRENYGRIYVNISDPISVRDRLKKRTVPDWDLPSYRHNLTESEKKDVLSFAWDLVRQQQKEAITPVAAVLAALLSWRPLDIRQLTDFFLVFNGLLADHGTPCLIPGDPCRHIEDCLDVHKLTFRPNPQGCYIYQPNLPESADLQARAAARLALQSYTNQLLGPLVNVAMFCYFKSKQLNSYDICAESTFFASYFKDEFVLIERLSERDVASFTSLHPAVMDVLAPLLQPYVESFYILLHLLDMGFSTTKDLQAQYRRVATCMLEENISRFTEILAIDKVPRHLPNLTQNGNLRILKSNGTTNYSVIDVSSLMIRLGPYVDPQFKTYLISYREQSVQLQAQL